MRRKVFLLLCLCFISSSAHAGTFNLIATDIGNGQVAIGYEGADAQNLPAGFGLNATLTNGATFSNVVSSSSYFPIYPSTIIIEEYGAVTDWGTPVSPSSMPGSLGGIGTNGITLEMAAQLSPLEVGIDPQDARDLNWDGWIDLFDMGIFVQEWLMTSDPMNPESTPGDLVADINWDFYVNMLDLSILVGGTSDPNVPVPPLNLSQLMVLEIDLNGAANTTLTILDEAMYRGGIVLSDGTAAYVVPVIIEIPEPTTLLLLGIGGLVLRKKHGL